MLWTVDIDGHETVKIVAPKARAALDIAIRDFRIQRVKSITQDSNGLFGIHLKNGDMLLAYVEKV